MLPMKSGSPNDFQTPPEGLIPLIPYLRKDWVVWECAAGKGYITKELSRLGYQVVSSDINHIQSYDFLTMPAMECDVIVTNPPFDMKGKFLERCYQVGKPFALLLPLTALETNHRQRLFERYGVDIIFMNKRINFETPNQSEREKEGKKSSSWFATAWFTWRLGINKNMVFAGMNNVL